MADFVTATSEDGIAVLTLDDGRLNTFDEARFNALVTQLDATADAPAVAIVGRQGMLTAGLDLQQFDIAATADLRRMLVTFGETIMRVWLEPRPVVVAATGHAIAAGTMLSMAADHTVAADGDYRWGLTETAIGLLLPDFGIALGRHNVPPHRLDDLLLAGRTLTPAEAVEAGFADELAMPDDVIPRALAQARQLATLKRGVYAEQKRRLRGAAVECVLAGLWDDIDTALATDADA